MLVRAAPPSVRVVRMMFVLLYQWDTEVADTIAKSSGWTALDDAAAEGLPSGTVLECVVWKAEDSHALVERSIRNLGGAPTYRVVEDEVDDEDAYVNLIRKKLRRTREAGKLRLAVVV